MLKSPHSISRVDFMAKAEKYHQQALYEPVKVETFKTNIVSQDFGPGPLGQKEPADYDLIRISSAHGRSLEVKQNGEKEFWEDEYGNLFGSRSIKGYPLYPPEIRFDRYSPSRLRVEGLMDRTGVTRIKWASKLMRQNHLPTERIVEQRKILEVPFDGKIISIEEWKQKIMENPTIVEDPQGKEPPVNPDKVREYIEFNEFYVFQRDCQVGQRLRDFERLNSYLDSYAIVRPDSSVFIGDYDIELGGVAELVDRRAYIIDQFAAAIERFKQQGVKVGEIEECKAQINTELDAINAFLGKNKKHKGIVSSGFTFRDNLKDVFQWVNFRNSHSRDQQDIVLFNAEDDEDVSCYFTYYLPCSMGEYLYKFHHLGLRHGFATGHNWTFAGTLVDLDSVHGRPLEDPENTASDIQLDVNSSLSAIKEYFSSHSQEVKDPNGKKIKYNGYLKQLFKRKLNGMAEQAKVNFLCSYIKTRDTLHGDNQKKDEQYYLSESKQLTSSEV